MIIWEMTIILGVGAYWIILCLRWALNQGVLNQGIAVYHTLHYIDFKTALLYTLCKQFSEKIGITANIYIYIYKVSES